MIRVYMTHVYIACGERFQKDHGNIGRVRVAVVFIVRVDRWEGLVNTIF